MAKRNFGKQTCNTEVIPSLSIYTDTDVDVLVIMNPRPHEIKGARVKWVVFRSLTAHREHFVVTGIVQSA